LAALFSIAKEIKQMKKGWSFKGDRRLMELARSGKTLQEIAKAMNWSSDRIRKVAVRLGLPVKSQTPKQ
jgi:ribosomal protein S6